MGTWAWQATHITVTLPRSGELESEQKRKWLWRKRRVTSARWLPRWWPTSGALAGHTWEPHTCLPCLTLTATQRGRYYYCPLRWGRKLRPQGG